MKTLRFLIPALLFFGTIMFAVTGCSGDNSAKSGTMPKVMFPFEKLDIDLNDADYPQIVCIITSEVGLRSVSTFLVKEGGKEEQLDQPVTSFYNPHHYSITKMPLYTEEMRGFGVIAEDFAGQTSFSFLPLKIIPMTPLPELYFTDKTGSVINLYTHTVGDPQPFININIESEEELNSLTLYEIKGTSVMQITESTTFLPGQTTAVLDLVGTGNSYEFLDGLNAIKAKVSAGPRNRIREATLTVRFAKALDVIIDNQSHGFNALTANTTYPFSGKVAYSAPVASMTFQLLDRKNVPLDTPQILNFTPSGTNEVSFSDQFSAMATLGYIKIDVISTAGHEITHYIDVHVGYRYLYLLTSMSGDGRNTNLSNTHGMLLSVTDGRMYNFCDAMAVWQKVDVGFSIWSSNTEARVQWLNAQKFQTVNSCNPYPEASYPQHWPGRNDYTVSATTSITFVGFMAATAADLAAETGGAHVDNGICMAQNFATIPSGQRVGFFQPMVNGVPKKTIVCFDKLESANVSEPFKSTFWIHVKTQL